MRTDSDNDDLATLKKDKTERMKLMRTRFQVCTSYYSENFKQWKDDVEFVSVAGKQWSEATKKQRGSRPCYEFNRLRQHIRQVTGDQRQNRPAIKARPTEEGDKDLAETMQGLIRNIESVSNADQAYDTGFECAVTGGYGVWQIITEYSDDDAFNQDIKIVEITNPLSVMFDPSAKKYDKRDANYVLYVERYPILEFQRDFPDEELCDFSGDFTNEAGMWMDEDSIVVCQHWYITWKNVKLHQLENGKTVYDEDLKNLFDESGKPLRVIRTRTVRKPEVRMDLATGAGIISESRWAGKYLPFVPVYGDIVDIEGDVSFNGMVRFGKDAQRSYNFHRTTSIETIANAPKVPYMVTAEQIKGYEPMWKQANNNVTPYLIYNPVGNAGAPKREGGVDVPVALVQASQQDAEDIKAVTGQFDASMGMRSNETSGVAINARKREGDTATYSYIDNLSRSIQFTGEIFVDLIPKIYDTERVVRVLGVDSAPKWVKLNEMAYDANGNPTRVNDLAVGKYDVTVTVGSSYATQRQESADIMMKMMENPNIAPAVADLLVKNLDIPNGDELEKRLRKIGIANNIITPTEEDAQEGEDPVQQAVQQVQEQAQQQLMALQQQAEQALKEQADKLQALEANLVKAQLQLEATRNDKSLERVKHSDEVELRRAELTLEQFKAKAKKEDDERAYRLKMLELNILSKNKVADREQKSEQFEGKMKLDTTKMILDDKNKSDDRVLKDTHVQDGRLDNLQARHDAMQNDGEKDDKE